MLPTASHPLREELHDEVHARPPLPVASPSRVTCLALLAGNEMREREWQGLRDLGARFGLVRDEAPTGYFSADFGAFRLKWERHTEFSRYVFVVDGASLEGGSEAPFAHPAIEAVPADWFAALPGEIIFAGHAEIIAASSCDAADLLSLSRRGFADRPLVGSTIADDKATALTDFRVDEGGYSRLLLIDRGLTPAQAGRAVQSLLEIDLYRMLALLAFPVARQLALLLSRDERELAAIADLLVKAPICLSKPMQPANPCCSIASPRCRQKSSVARPIITIAFALPRPTTKSCSVGLRRCASSASAACRLGENSWSGDWVLP